MGAATPKQYLEILNQPVIEHTLARLLEVQGLEKIVIAVSAEDRYWSQLAVAGHSRVETVLGGEERSDSVYNSLQFLSGVAREDDWVLVHDVARPCVQVNDIERMMEQLQSHGVGGVLAVPVSDTIKRVSGTAIEETVDRSHLWQAQTPQMFRLGTLRNAIKTARERGMAMTDEASAIELLGLQPEVVEGSGSNIKITRPEDLALAEFYLSRNLVEEFGRNE